MKIIAVVQARMGSKRLPGKSLIDLAGKPMLDRVLARLALASSIDEIAVATTDQPRDDEIATLCAAKGWLCARGSEEDVLDRYVHVARRRSADVVVRITADCPLIDPGVVDQVVDALETVRPPADYVSNTLATRTFPRGLDTEAFTSTALERAWREDTDPASREHVTPYLYRRPDLFRLRGVFSQVDRSDMRWVVDTPADLTFVRCIYGHFRDEVFSSDDVISLLREHPEWLELSSQVAQKVV